MTPDAIFPVAWFLDSENTWGDFHVLAYDDLGTLTVGDGELEFRGSKMATTIRHITRIALVRQGRDFINHWVKIDYVEGEVPATVYLADGSSRGWGGILGGTRRMYGAIEESLSRHHSDPVDRGPEVAST